MFIRSIIPFSTPMFGFSRRVLLLSSTSTGNNTRITQLSTTSTTTTTTNTTNSQSENDHNSSSSSLNNESNLDTNKLMEQIKEKDIKIKEIMNVYQRSLADAQNLRERTKREVEQAHQYAIQKFAKDMLSIADVLAIALNTVKTEDLSQYKQLRDLHEGLTLTSNELHNTLHRHGVERIDAVEGDKFDPSIHQAIYQAPVPNRPPGTLLQVTKTGYKLHGRVLRPVEVGVVQE